ncbi:MAG: 2-hydroxychromene-2-carboxylate isomerase [Pseudomonadota bacterium]
MSAAELSLWFDFASTYSYPSVMTAEARAAARGLRLRWRPVLLGPIFAAQGWRDSPFNLYPAKGRYMWRDLERICATEGLPWRQPEIFPAHSLLAARVSVAGRETPWLGDFVRGVFRAQFADGSDIAKPETLAAVLAEIGAGGEALEAAASEPVKQTLRAEVAEAQRLGLFGAPSFTVGEELFWGHDRMAAALDWAGR